MPTYEIQAPNGRVYQIDGPEGATDEQVRAEVMRQNPELGGAAPSGPPSEVEQAIPTLQEAYSGIAEPVTKAVGWAARNNPMATLAQYLTGTPDATMDKGARSMAVFAVPQTPVGGAAAVAGAATGGMGYLANILGPALAAGGASLLGGSTGKEAATDAAWAGAAGGLAKGAADVGGALIRKAPYVKDIINEGNSSALQNALTRIDPAAGRAVENQSVSDMLRGGTTMAKLRQAATGGDIHKAASSSMDAAMQEVNALAGHPVIPPGGALDRAYAIVPDMVKDELIGPIGPGGYTLEQAQQIRSYLASKAFALSPHGQGISPAAQQSLWQKVTGEIEGMLTPEAKALWQQANRAYGGSAVIDEFLNAVNAKQGLPNRMFLNRNALSDYLDINRQDLIRRMGGREAFDQIVTDVLGGAQPGTRDILVSGSGTPLAALQQSIGRGTNTGSAQGIGVPLRTALPGLGSEYTGRAPFTAPDSVQALINYLTQQSADQFKQAQQGRPVKIGPMP